MKISRETHVGGVQLVRITRALAELEEAWRRNGWAARSLARKLHAPPDMAFPLCRELEELGWLTQRRDIEDDMIWVLTDRGKDLISARIGKPVRRATGVRHLRQFLERILRVERARGWPLQVASVEIFGDFLCRKDQIMDIELVVDLEPRNGEDAPRYGRSSRRFRTQRDEVWDFLRDGSSVLTLYPNPHRGMTDPHKLLYMRANQGLPLLTVAAKECFPLEALDPTMNWDEYASRKYKRGA